MNIVIKEIRAGEWVAIPETGHPGVPKPPLAIGATRTECILNLERWTQDRAARGLTPTDPI